MENVIENTVNAVTEEVVTPQIETQTTEPAQDTGVTPETATPEPAQSAEENAKYAKVRRDAEEKARAKAQDDTIAELYGESHGIHTMADYKSAVAAQKEAERLAEMQEKGVDPDYLKTLIESDPEVKSARQLLADQKQKDADTANRLEFLDYFKESNGRDYDATKDEIPMETWELTLKGVPLKQAYTLTEAKMLRAELAALKAGKTAEETNRKNADSSPGNIDGEAVAEPGYISAETFEANRSNRSWVVKNLEKITASRKSWG